MFKSIIATVALIAAASTASAYTCKNTVEIIDGEYVYTSSQCTGQNPATQATLDQMSFAANNPGNDDQREEAVETPAAVVVAEPTKLEKRLAKMKTRKDKLTSKIQSLSGGKKKKALKAKRSKLNKRINKVTARINGTGNANNSK